MTEPTPEAALTVLERRARQGCQSSSALSEVLAALDTLRTLAARVAAVEALCDHGQVMTQAQFDAARHPLLTVDPGPTVAGDAMEVNSDTPEGEQ